MRNLASILLDSDEPEPLSRNRRLERVMQISSLDFDQTALLAQIAALRLQGFYRGEVDLLADELSRLAVILRDALRQQNDKRERLLSKRRVRKIRKARSPGAVAASLSKARAARAVKLGKLPAVAGEEDSADSCPPTESCHESTTGLFAW
jgi:hypothetical protein